MNDIKIGVATPEQLGAEFVQAWETALERGVPERPSVGVYFTSLSGLLKTLSEQRLVLLRTLRRSGAMSIRALARNLGRDYKNVHADVQILKRCGLIAEGDDGVRTPWDKIQAELDLAA